jgi:hypothetical protein
MSTKYSPGPWVIKKKVTPGEFVTETLIVTADGGVVANVAAMNQEANARLIAAIPELLIALKIATECAATDTRNGANFKREEFYHPELPNGDIDYEKLVADCRALIARVEGGGE